MKLSIATKKIAASAICILASPAFSHVVLETPTAPSGSTYQAVFQVGHGCQGSATTGITVRIPAGFQGAKPFPKAGWNVVVKQEKLDKPYDKHGKQVTQDVSVVSWTAASKAAALQDAHFDEFKLRGRLPNTAGPLWFKIIQRCGNASIDWSETPSSGTSTQGMKSPAALLEVTGNGQVAEQSQAGQPVAVSNAWVRSTVAGQKSSGAFMTVTARTAMDLVGIASPVAGVAEVHEMKMEADVMKMRALPALDLPAGKAVQLNPGGFHIMLMDLKQPLVNGSFVPLSLVLRDSKGIESRVELKLPVLATAPGAPALKTGAPDHSGHQH